MKRSRATMTRYLLRETRYVVSDLNRLEDKVLEKWYKEEIECNKAK